MMAVPVPHYGSHMHTVRNHRLPATRRPFLAACVARARPGTLIFTPPSIAAMVSISGTARISSRSRAVTSAPRSSSSTACLAHGN